MQYKDFKNVHVMEHPLIKHKISLLRSEEHTSNSSHTS